MNISKVYKTIRFMGLSWVAFRVFYALKKRRGYFQKKSLMRPWNSVLTDNVFTDRVLLCAENYAAFKRSNKSTFFFEKSNFIQWKGLFSAIGETDTLNEQVKDIQNGVHIFFEKEKMQVGIPPDWHKNPFTGESIPQGIHWSQMSDFGFGDIKIIWELSRFSFVFPLVRSFARGDSDVTVCARLFWEFFENWMKNNPPATGCNWKCGQETALRLMAVAWGFYAFIDEPDSTDERIFKVMQFMHESAQRIEVNLDYAISQKNNHGISECVGLMTVALLFPEFAKSKAWLDLGLKHLTKQVDELVYADGGFSQHSMNYHRVMMQDLLWIMRLLELNGKVVPALLREKLSLAVNYIFQCQNLSDGSVPCFGANDGAHIFQLSNCAYGDFRPHVNAAYAYLHGTALYGNGSWNEEALWILGRIPEAKKGNVKQGNLFVGKESGCHILRNESAMVFFRCGSFVHRPGHCDLLHVDICVHGVWITCGPGTYSYNAKPPFEKAFSGTAVHNTITVDGVDQMEKVSRFLRLPVACSIIDVKQTVGNTSIAGVHKGYKRLKYPVLHEREIRLEKDELIILDRLSCSGKHHYDLHWLFPYSFPYSLDEKGTLELQSENGSVKVKVSAEGDIESRTFDVYVADKASDRGWRAPYYNELEEAISLTHRFRGGNMVIETKMQF